MVRARRADRPPLGRRSRSASARLVAAFVRPAAVAGHRGRQPGHPADPGVGEACGDPQLGHRTTRPSCSLGIYVLLACSARWSACSRCAGSGYGLAGIAVFGAFGVYCALTANASHGSRRRPDARRHGGRRRVLAALVRGWSGRAAATSERADRARGCADRRAFLQGSAAAAGLAAIAGFGGRAAQHARFDVAADRGQGRAAAAGRARRRPRAARRRPRQERRAVARPRAATSTASTPRSTVPQIDPDDLAAAHPRHGRHEITLTYAELLARPHDRALDHAVLRVQRGRRRR